MNSILFKFKYFLNSSDIMFCVTLKKDSESTLRSLRLSAGISQRELARRIGERQSNIAYWEQAGKTPRSDLLVPITEALGCTIEQLLGEEPKRKVPKGGKMRQLFDAASQLPRRQQEKIIAVLEPFVKEHHSS
ncbi:MAG: helix-turn-helix transcriptional regulator [Puniceicoccaceae bacterium]|nr:helix-turn-helix transcriptional regulator [Puniceicoccaceae bacterium]